METEKDYTDLAVIKQAIREGMAPFKVDELEVSVYHSFGGYVITVRLWKRLDRTWGRVVVDDAEMVKDPSSALAIAANIIFESFRARQIVPEPNHELGED